MTTLTLWIEDKNQVLFNYSKFQLLGSHGSKYVRGLEVTWNNHKNQMPTVKHNGEILMQWYRVVFHIRVLVDTLTNRSFPYIDSTEVDILIRQ